MHICFIEDTYLHGGTQIWVSEAVRDFLSKGHKVTVLTARDGFNAKDTQKTDAGLVTYDFHDVIQQDAQHVELWTSALAEADVAVCTVHPPRDGFHCSTFAAQCIEAAGLGTILEPKTGTIVPEYKREFYAPSASINSHVISITQFTQRYLVETYRIAPEKVSLVYQGTDVATFTSDAAQLKKAQQTYSVPAGAGPVLGNVGSFEHRKGQVLLLEAVTRMKQELPNVHLLLVGDGPDEEMLRAKVTELDLGGHVSFFPFTREPAQIFEVIDILVLSSLYKEGLPNVILEALSMGRPIVSSRMAGVPEAVIDGETGWMVEPGNAEDLAGAVTKLWRDPAECRRMGQAGRRLAETRFDKRRQFDAFLEHFRALIEVRDRAG